MSMQPIPRATAALAAVTARPSDTAPGTAR